MANPINAITSYVRSSIAELKKVTWPNKETTMRYSMLVIVVSIAVAAFFGALDFGFSRLVTFTLSLGKTAQTPAAEQEVPVVPDVNEIEAVTDETGVDIETSGEQTGSFTVDTEEDADLEPSFSETGGAFDLPPME
jgi:preprotein translocase SecE subunit